MSIDLERLTEAMAVAAGMREHQVRHLAVGTVIAYDRLLSKVESSDIAAEADRGTHWHHRCDIPACNCGRCHDCGEQVPEADRGTGNALQRLAEQARTAATYDEWHALGRAVIALAEATK